MRPRHLAIALLAGLFLAVLAAIFAAPASALITVTGDWVVSGVESYSADTIQVVANGSTGNVYILPGGELYLDQILLILPNNRTLDNQGFLQMRNSTVRGPNWFFYLRSGADLSDVILSNVSRNTGGGLSGTVITNASVALRNVRWDYNVSGFGQAYWAVHVRTILDFHDNFIGRRGQLSYELPTISSDVQIAIYNNRFASGTGFMGFDRTDELVISAALHTGNVVFEIRDNNFTDGNDGINFGSSSSSTTYLVHDNIFTASASTAIEIGDGAASDRFGGVLRLWNISTIDANRALRVFGAIGAGVEVSVENWTLLRNPGMGTPDTGIVANEATINLANSTINMRLNDTQYQAESNGHIKIRATVDRALVGVAVTQTGASVEHLVFLNVLGATWQNNVPILGDGVFLREATGNLSLTLDPATWSPREIVWWGVYRSSPQVDNRDLRPEVVDGPLPAFACAPKPFLVTEPMTPLSIVCTDDRPPTITVTKPTPGQLQNRAILTGNGSGAEYGSGLNTFEWSFNNASWGPLTLGPGPMDWTLSTPAQSDGTFTLYLRAIDRTGLATYRSIVGVVIDLTPPTLTIPALVDFSSNYQLNISGMTEGFATVTYVLGAAQPVSTTAASDGSFEFPNIALSEGHNTLWVTAVDAAGNSFSLQRNITVDTVPPSLVVFQSNNMLTPETFQLISGNSEPGAVVRVNGATAPRAADAFSFTMSLIRGSNPVTVTSTDAAGNQASWYGVVVCDNDLPVLTASIITGNSTPDGIPITRVGSVPVTGSATDATTSIVQVTVNGTAYAVDSTGNFQLSLPVSEGDTAIRVSATDLAGNTATVTLHVLRDSTAPVAVASVGPSDQPVVTIDGERYTRGNFVVVTLAMSEDGTATVAGQTRNVTVGPNVFNVSISEGSNTISISFRDRAGNAGTPTTIGVERDTTAPALTISSPPDGTAIDGANAQVSGVSEPGAEVTVNGVRVGLTGAGFTTQVAIAAGTGTTITVVATDALGNSNTKSVTVTRRSETVITTPSEGFSGILMLAVGLGAGLAAGILLRGRSKGRQDHVEEQASEMDSPGAYAPEPSASRGPKGPRGPAPPPGQ